MEWIELGSVLRDMQETAAIALEENTQQFKEKDHLDDLWQEVHETAPVGDPDMNPATLLYSPYQIVIKMPFSEWVEQLLDGWASGEGNTSADTVAELAAINEGINETSVSIPPSIKKGSTNKEAVKQLQALLNEKNEAGLTVDGAFGNGTKNAVKAYQTKVSITPVNGEVGPLTWSRLLGMELTPEQINALEGGTPPMTPAQAAMNSGVEVVGTLVYHEADVALPENSGSINTGQAGKFDLSKFNDPVFNDNLYTKAMEVYIREKADYPDLKQLSPALYEKIRKE